MSRISRVTFVAAISVFSIFGAAEHSFSQGAGTEWPKDIERTVSSFNGDDIDIKYLNAAAEQNQAQTWVQLATPEQRAGLIEAVRANKSLMEKLRAKNVEIENIGGAMVAADGGLTIYVR
ncbi:hypothetical protein [Rhizobium sp. LjRoot258]|uniref:hypothetical protein n=1 Tax=Rhizobium sp. LjRoot258 TaxID=3342299 RepID=UPI003ED13104